MTIVDDRTPEERQYTVGFWVATDSFMSGWGKAKGRSLFAIPIFNDRDSDNIRELMHQRNEMKRIRYIAGSTYRPKMNDGDHLHIGSGNTWRR